MSSETKKTPWKNGYWYNYNFKPYVYEFNGENMIAKNAVSLYVPESEPVKSMSGHITYGEYGPAHPDIIKVKSFCA